MAFSDARQCKAKAKGSGEQCKNPAVEGKEVCRVHGATAGRPPIHGRYSITRRAGMQEKVSQFYNDPAAGDLRSELALLRAFLQDYLDRFVNDEDVKVLALDIDRVFGMVESIGRLVERIAKILATTALTQAELQLLQVTMIDAIAEFIPDPERQRAFISRVFGSLRGIHGSGAGIRTADTNSTGVIG